MASSALTASARKSELSVVGACMSAVPPLGLSSNAAGAGRPSSTGALPPVAGTRSKRTSATSRGGVQTPRRLLPPPPTAHPGSVGTAVAIAHVRHLGTPVARAAAAVALAHFTGTLTNLPRSAAPSSCGAPREPERQRTHKKRACPATPEATDTGHKRAYRGGPAPCSPSLVSTRAWFVVIGGTGQRGARGYGHTSAGGGGFGAGAGPRLITACPPRLPSWCCCCRQSLTRGSRPSMRPARPRPHVGRRACQRPSLYPCSHRIVAALRVVRGSAQAPTRAAPSHAMPMPAGPAGAAARVAATTPRHVPTGVSRCASLLWDAASRSACLHACADAPPAASPLVPSHVVHPNPVEPRPIGASSPVQPPVPVPMLRVRGWGG